MSIKVLGTGFYVPRRAVTNDELSQMVDTSDEWIMQRVGIRERRVSVDETTADMATKAARNALVSAGIEASELDLIVVGTISSDTACPTVAGMVQRAIGAKCPAFDISSACSGFMFALETAAAYVARGNVKNVLVIGAERLSKLLDWKDRSTCIIFGDGAGAAVVTKGEGYLASTMYTQGSDEVLFIPDVVGSSPFYERTEKPRFVYMDGQETFKFAVGRIARDVKEVAEKAGITLDRIDHVVTHQANIRIIEFASKKLKIPMEKFFVNIEKYGNTSAASVPIALAELHASGKLKRGDIVALCAFGGGLSSAACIIKW